METASSKPGAWHSRPLTCLLGGLAGVSLAGVGEFLVASGDTMIRPLLLYLAGILLFAVSARHVSPSPADLPAAEPAGPDSRLRRSVMAAGVAVATLLGIAATRQVYLDLNSKTGLHLWLASLLVLIATSLAAGGGPGWPARWGSKLWPTSARSRWMLGAAFVALFAVAAAARLLSLKTLPYGIEADEGDQGALAIQVARGNPTPGIFEDGWYQLSMMYFWLLAQLLKVIGIGFAEARVFSALASILTVVAVTWLAARNFGLRVGLLAGVLLSLMGVSLQFARLTTVATPTAMLWAVSMAFLLEAARRGKDRAWIGAGLAGGFSLYFYPTGRLWAVLAAAFCVALFVHGLGGLRWRILRGTALAAVAALLIAGPFLALGVRRPLVLWERAKTTSIFARDNATRLSYYRREWSMPRLVFEQTARSIGIFNRYADEGGVWPTKRPIMGHGLAMLTLLGLGWCCLRWRDPRFLGLALWFWVGFVGVIVTVETPNLHRMATAVPVLALFPALVLDNLGRRVEALLETRTSGRSRALRWAATSLAGLVALALIRSESRFYFVDYAKMDGWPHPRVETTAVASQGSHTLVVSVGRYNHMVNSGWNRLMAPNTPHGGIPSPGSDLPLAVPASDDLAFLVYPGQHFYLPYLQQVYPGGAVQRWTHPSEGLVVSTYRLTRERWAATQGALATPASGPSLRVPTLGHVPAGWGSDVGPVRWTAGLRVPRYWNYRFQIGPGPARLTIDGKQVLVVPPGTTALSATASLARGVHAVAYEATLAGPGHQPFFRWAPGRNQAGAPPLEDAQSWQPVHTEALTAGLTAPEGLLGIVQMPERPEQRRIDATIATCCLSGDINAAGRSYQGVWTGTLTAPETGSYTMGLFTTGSADLKLDGKSVVRASGDRAAEWTANVQLAAGPHAVELAFHSAGDPGTIEWTWTPPGGISSIVPPSVLSPPPGAGVGPPLPATLLESLALEPLQSPLFTVP